MRVCRIFFALSLAILLISNPMKSCADIGGEGNTYRIDEDENDIPLRQADLVVDNMPS